MKSPQKKLIYLYCVTKTKPRRRNFKDISVRTYPIYSDGIYAAVSKVSLREFSEKNLKENLTDMKWVEKKVRQHERIIEEVMKDATVLPFKFGTIFDSEGNVENLLKEQNIEFKKIIANLEGKEERGIKIYCDIRKFKEILVSEDERIKEKEKEIASAGKGKAYLLKKKKDEFIKDIANERISDYTQDCFERLRRSSMESKTNKILPKQVTEKKEDMVLNATFLIRKDQEQEFSNVVEYLKAKYADKGLSFDYTGPWPPYNFCQTKPELTEQGESTNE